MPSLMEEIRRMMPGRALSDWSLAEASEDDDFEYELQQTRDMVARLNKAQSRFHAELKRLSGYDGWTSYDAGVTHGRVFAPFGTFARINFILNHIDKQTGVIRMYRVEVQVSPRYREARDVREVDLQVYGTIRSQKAPSNRETDVEFRKTFTFDLGKGEKSDRYDDPAIVLAKAGPVFDKVNKMMPKGMEEVRDMMPGRARLNWSLTPIVEGSSGGKSEHPQEGHQFKAGGKKWTITKVHAAEKGPFSDNPVHKIELVSAKGNKVGGTYQPHNKTFHVFDHVKVHKAKYEDIAGAPGPFVDRAGLEDLLDRVRSPRWEYPSWALPKEDLAEAAPSKQALLKAMQAYLGGVDHAPVKVQQRLYNAVMKIVQQIATQHDMDSSEVWDQAEAAARKKGITKAVPGKDF